MSPITSIILFIGGGALGGFLGVCFTYWLAQRNTKIIEEVEGFKQKISSTTKEEKQNGTRH